MDARSVHGPDTLRDSGGYGSRQWRSQRRHFGQILAVEDPPSRTSWQPGGPRTGKRSWKEKLSRESNLTCKEDLHKWKRKSSSEGKAKKVYATEDPEKLIVSYKDDATAFNGLQKGTISGKGDINNP